MADMYFKQFKLNLMVLDFLLFMENMADLIWHIILLQIRY